MKRTLVLIPGMMCDTRLFSPQVEYFSKNYQVIVADITGADTVKQLARQLLLSLPEKFVLLGFSMGGIIALEMMKQLGEAGRQKRVAGLVLLDTNAKAEKSEVANRRNKQMKLAEQGCLEDVIRDEMKPNYLAIDGANNQSIRNTCMEMALNLGAGVFLRQSKALQKRPDQLANLKNIVSPTLVLCGESDTLCPVSYHEEMTKEIPNSLFHVIKDAAHFPVLEQPTTTNRIIEEWLGKL